MCRSARLNWTVAQLDSSILFALTRKHEIPGQYRPISNSLEFGLNFPSRATQSSSLSADFTRKVLPVSPLISHAQSLGRFQHVPVTVTSRLSIGRTDPCSNVNDIPSEQGDSDSIDRQRGHCLRGHT